jgi:2-haloacid dehalogenase
VVVALQRLKRRHIICCLPNGSLGLLTRMARRAGLSLDCVLSAGVFRAYKPEPATCLGVRACSTCHRPRDAVAAHHDDLAGARACGLRTAAYIERPLEIGTRRPKDVAAQPGNDLHSGGRAALADRLGC